MSRVFLNTFSSRAARPLFLDQIKRHAERYCISQPHADKTLWIYVITIDFPEKWRLISVSQGKTDGSYLVTMEVDIFGEKYMRTSNLDFRQEDFLKFVERELVFKESIKKEAVVLSDDLTLIWKQQPKSLAKEN